MTNVPYGTEYTTAGGMPKTTHQVTINNCKLPCLSKTRCVSRVFEIISEGVFKSNYRVFLGLQKMRELDIDTSV